MLAGPRIYSTGPGVGYWGYNIKSLDHAREVLKQYSKYYNTKTIKMYLTGNRKHRQWIIQAAKEQELMPTTEGGLDFKLNVTQILDGYPGHEHSFPIYPLRLEHYAEIKDFSAGAMFLSEDYFRMTALTLTILASASNVCTSKPYKLGSALLAVITLMTFGLFNFFRLHTGADIGLSLFIVPEVILLAILAIVMIDPMRPDEPHLTVGIGVVLITGMAFDLVSTLADDMYLGRSYYFIANNHLAQHGLMLFAFFAAWFRWKLPQGPQWCLWVHSGALGSALLLTYLPMMTIGQRGGMRHMPDSTDEFPVLHLTSSIGSAVLVVVILLGLVAPRLFSSRR